MAPLVKHLDNHEELRLDSQHPCKKPSTVAHVGNPSLGDGIGKGNRWVPVAHGDLGSVRDCLRKGVEQLRKILDDDLGPPHTKKLC